MENLTSPALVVPPDDASPENSFADILSEFEQRQRGPARGEAIDGTVVSITPDSIFVDIGRKMDGTLAAELFRDSSGKSTIQVGDRLKVSITGTDSEGSYTLSTVKVERPRDWSALERAFRRDNVPSAA